MIRPVLPLVRRHAHKFGWAVLAFTVLFWRLGATSFWDPDEAHYAETTREMLATGDWLTPRYNDQPFFDKPVFFHWLQALPMAALGPTETAARLVPALACLALIGVTWWVGAVLVSVETGFIAALLLTTNAAVFALARYAILDSVFAALLFGGAASVTVAALANRPRLQYAGYVLIALATLTKGPVAIVLCGLPFLVAIALSVDARRKLLGLRWVLGLAIVLAIATPWYVYMLAVHGRAFVDGYFLNENVLLFSRPLYGGQPGWWFYLQIVLLALLPWTGLLLGRLYDDVRTLRTKRMQLDAFELLLWLWVASIVGFFSLSQFKLDHYVFPAAPALCLLIARGWTEMRAREHHRLAIGVRVGWHTVGPCLAIAGIAIGVLTLYRLAVPDAALVMPASLTAVGLVLSLMPIRVARAARAPWLAAAALGVLYAGALVWIVPVLESQKVVPDIARWVARRAGGRERVATYILNRWEPSFRFYFGGHVEMLEGPDTAAAFFDAPEPFYCVMRRSSYHELVAQGAPLRIVHAHHGVWATSGMALWRDRPEATQFVVVTNSKPR